MKSSYRGSGNVAGVADMIPQKAYIGHNEKGVGNIINGLAAIYKTYDNIPDYIKWEVFGDEMAFARDQNSLNPLFNEDGTRKYTPKETASEDQNDQTYDADNDINWDVEEADLDSMENQYDREQEANKTPDPVNVEASGIVGYDYNPNEQSAWNAYESALMTATKNNLDTPSEPNRSFYQKDVAHYGKSR